MCIQYESYVVRDIYNTKRQYFQYYSKQLCSCNVHYNTQSCIQQNNHTLELVFSFRRSAKPALIKCADLKALLTCKQEGNLYVTRRLYESVMF